MKFKNNGSTKKTTEELFWEKVSICSDNECWEWLASKNPDGYGMFYPKSRPSGIGAHKFSWMLKNGDVPVGLELLHKCDNRRCVNPNHIVAGTHLENIRDMISKGRGYNRNGERNPRAILCENDVREIKSMRRGGMAYKTIANIKNVSIGCVNHIINGRHWSWVR